MLRSSLQVHLLALFTLTAAVSASATSQLNSSRPGRACLPMIWAETESLIWTSIRTAAADTQPS
jgi:hypothetical protein